MNKADLIEHVALAADLSKASAGRAVDAFLEGVAHALQKGESVSLVGFGSFAVARRAERTGRNPRTGASIQIKSTRTARFRPGKALRDSLL